MCKCFTLQNLKFIKVTAPASDPSLSDLPLPSLSIRDSSREGEVLQGRSEHGEGRAGGDKEGSSYRM